MNASILCPGYAIQGSFIVRDELAEAELYIQKKSRIAGYATRAATMVTDAAIGFPLGLLAAIEMTALTAINLVGAIFSRRCRDNLKFTFSSGNWYGNTISWISVYSTMQLFQRPLSIVTKVAAFVILNSLFSVFVGWRSPENRSYCWSDEFYRLQAIRKHDYEKMKLLLYYNTPRRQKIYGFLRYRNLSKVSRSVLAAPFAGIKKCSDELRSLKRDLRKSRKLLKKNERIYKKSKDKQASCWAQCEESQKQIRKFEASKKTKKEEIQLRINQLNTLT